MKKIIGNIFGFVILMLCGAYMLNIAQTLISLQSFLWMPAFIFAAAITAVSFFFFYFMGFVLALYYRYRPDCGRAICIDDFYVGVCGIYAFFAMEAFGFIKAINMNKKRALAPRFKQTWRFSPL